MRSALAVLALLLSGCAPMRWEKADATSEQLQRDSIECQQEAWREAHAGAFYSPASPIVVQDSMGRATVTWPGGPFAGAFGDPLLEEGRLAQFCMRARGYQLVPAEPRKAH
jgi:hypothetical protein